MKKVLLIIIMCIFVFPMSVRADHMYRVDMNIELLEDGSANVTEIWDVEADSGTEWYKQVLNLREAQLSDFVVKMDGNLLTYKEWNVDESLEEKGGYYGINYVNDGLELCFGKYDYGRHIFTLNYRLSNFIFNVEDSQVLYWTLFPKLVADNFSVIISGYYSFPDTLEVWGYGNKGYTYVENGLIKMSNEGTMDGDYVVLLVKFPLNTFDTFVKYDDYSNFESVLMAADEGTYKYDYYNEEDDFPVGIVLGIQALLVGIISFFSIKSIYDNGYGYLGNKKIDKKDVPMFRDIPCNKDIYYANVLIKLNKFGYKDTNILGAIILKWIKNNKICFRNKKEGIFNKETSVIDLTMNPEFENEIEDKLFKMMYEASKDGILETKEFEKWCEKNYSEFLALFKKIEGNLINSLKKDTRIYHRVTKKDCKYRYVMDDKIYNDSIQLYGLKKYLVEFSKIDTKEVMEVKLWDEYLMFAYLFGIADKVAKQLKNMYPEIIDPDSTDGGGLLFDYDTLIFVNRISTRSVTAASTARMAAESYSAGGGGFTSGGGGGGSLGGGGSMGGR